MTQSAKGSQHRGLLIGAIVVLAVFALAAYAVLGWHRMDHVCSLDSTTPSGASPDTVDYGWSWVPPGFACTWDGTSGEPVTVVKLWW